MELIKLIFGIFTSSEEIDDEDEITVETTIKYYSGNALDGGEVEDEKAYNRYIIV